MASVKIPILDRDQDRLLSENGSVKKLAISRRKSTSCLGVWQTIFVISGWICAVTALVLVLVLYYQINNTYVERCKCTTGSGTRQDWDGAQEPRSTTPTADNNAKREKRAPVEILQRPNINNLDLLRDSQVFTKRGDSVYQHDGSMVMDAAYVDEEEDIIDDDDDDDEDDEDDAGEEVPSSNFYDPFVRNKRSAGASGAPKNKKNRHGHKKSGSRSTTCKLSAKRGSLQLKPSKRGADQSSCQDALDDYLDKKLQIQNAAIQVEANIEGVDMAALANGSSRQMENYQDETMAFWTMTNWSRENEATDKTYIFHRRQGAIEVQKSGLYYVYAQVTYCETRSPLQYYVINTKPESETEGDSVTKPESVKSVLMCSTGVDYVDPEKKAEDAMKFKSCVVSGVVYLDQADKLSVLAHQKTRVINPDPATTFWGIIRLAN